MHVACSSITGIPDVSLYNRHDPDGANRSLVVGTIVLLPPVVASANPGACVVVGRASLVNVIAVVVVSILVEAVVTAGVSPPGV